MRPLVNSVPFTFPADSLPESAGDLDGLTVLESGFGGGEIIDGGDRLIGSAIIDGGDRV